MPLNRTEKHALTFLAQHLFYGCTAGTVFGSAVLYTDMAGIWTLSMNSEHPFTVLALFFFGLLVTFGSVGMGVGIMSLAGDDDSHSDRS